LEKIPIISLFILLGSSIVRAAG